MNYISLRYITLNYITLHCIQHGVFPIFGTNLQTRSLCPPAGRLRANSALANFPKTWVRQVLVGHTQKQCAMTRVTHQTSSIVHHMYMYIWIYVHLLTASYSYTINPTIPVVMHRLFLSSEGLSCTFILKGDVDV